MVIVNNLIDHTFLREARGLKDGSTMKSSPLGTVMSAEKSRRRIGIELDLEKLRVEEATSVMAHAYEKPGLSHRRRWRVIISLLRPLRQRLVELRQPTESPSATYIGKVAPIYTKN